MSERRPKPGESLSFDFFFEPPKKVAAPSEPEAQSEGEAPREGDEASKATANEPSSPRARRSTDAPSLGVAVVPAPPLGVVSVPAAVPAPAADAAPEVFSVGALGRLLGRTLDRAFAEAVWVEGEVSGARPAPSGHLYFSLKDEEEDASIDVVLYRTNVMPRTRTLVKDGARVRVRGKPSYWSPRGRLQFVGDRLEPTGKGALLEALEKLKQKLAAEGLFAPEKKRALPHEPRVVGVVTSAAGAVIHDICKVAFRRGGAHVLLAPAQVQGAFAAESVRRALEQLQRVEGVDVIIVGRGGGSQDDLLAFHDEALVRAVAACRVPVVSAVGHEVDVTLVDFAADARAATPSQAAEMVVPDRAARRRLLDERSMRLRRAMHARLVEERATSERLTRAFGDPRLLIAGAQQRVDDQRARLERATTRRLALHRERQRQLSSRLVAAHPRERLARDEAKLVKLRGRLVELVERRVIARRATLAELGGRLDAMSPLKVLARGYAIATHAGRAVRDAAEIAPGSLVSVRVARGRFDARVEAVHGENVYSANDGGEVASPPTGSAESAPRPPSAADDAPPPRVPDDAPEASPNTPPSAGKSPTPRKKKR